MTGFEDNVLVVGGGVAGMAAATRLAECGVSCHLLEAAPSLGGRARSFVDPQSGDELDNGQHLLVEAYDHTWRLLHRIGSYDRLRPAKNVSFHFSEVVDGPPSRLALHCPGLPAPFHLLAGLLRCRGFSWRERFAAMRVGTFLRTADASVEKRWAQATAADLLSELRQPARVCRVLWNPLVVATLNLRADTASAGPLIRTLRRMFFADRHAARAVHAQVGLRGLMARPTIEYLQRRGSHVAVNARVRHIDIAPEAADKGASRATLTVRLQSGRQMEATAVICAVPHFHVSKLFAPARQDELGIRTLDLLGASPILGVTFWLDRPVMEQPFLGLVGTATEWVFNHTKVRAPFASQMPGCRQMLNTVVSASDAWTGLSPAQIRERTLADLRRHLPALRDATVLHARTIHERRATPAFMPANLHLRLPVTTRLPRLFFAGDWTDTGLPATIEGAAQSGHAAADAAVRFLRPNGKERHAHADRH